MTTLPPRTTLFTISTLASCLAGLCLFASSAAASPKGTPVREDVPWAVHTGDDLDLTDLERRYGVKAEDLPAVESFWDGTLLYTEDSYARDTLAQQDLPPLHASNYDPAPGILFLAMDGVTLSPNCGNGDVANAALNCSPLVDAESNFPAFGGESQQTALFNELASYYDPFNIVLTAARPPEWVPYTMAVIGGSAGNAGQPGGVCGVANVACDGLKRNHVSLTFPSSCNGVAETAAQETAHNWGLEHTDNTSDLLYPFNNGGNKSFIDDCMGISHATGDGVTQCDYIHELYCSTGEEQNTFQELNGVFGPREDDAVAPEIISFSPADGTTISSEESVTITAKVSENSNFLAARWTLVGGEQEISRCTNNVCDSDYNVGVGFDPNEIDWDFVTLTNAPAGAYEIQFEVIDAYGNYDSISLTVNVTEAEGSGSGPSTESETNDAGSDSEGETVDPDGSGGPSSDDGTGGPGDSGDVDDDDDSADESGSGTDGSGGGNEEDPGCGCQQRSPQRFGFLTLLFAGLTLVRRRRGAGASASRPGPTSA